jgi:hypothetical protein
VRRSLTALLSVIVLVSLTGCLGTVVKTRTSEGKSIETTHAHILAAPFRIDAHQCKSGMSKVVTYVPLWGVAVGILTIGIIVPKTTVYSCVK